MDEVPVQYFQTVTAIELAVAGGLLFQISFFRPRAATDPDALPNPWLRLVIAIVIGATLFGSLHAIRTGGSTGAAVAVTTGLAISLVPILLRSLPPLVTSDDPATSRHASTTVGLGLYVVAVIAVIVTIVD
jgi:hypothetical protein